MERPDALSTVTVHVKDAPYNILIGADILDRLDEVLPIPKEAHKCVLLTSETIYELYGERALRALDRTGLHVELFKVQDGEAAKSINTLQQCYNFFGDVFLGRRDIVLALGGGVIGDLGGFAAATWARGVYLVQVATTLVAQVDSAIGGKTGVNLASGKNLVGAFHQPIAVINDTSTLSTLPERELRAGLAEVVKYGFIADPVILDLVNGKSVSEIQRDGALLKELVIRSARIKASVVGADELEAGGREILNYGHTLGHALETLANYRSYLHGEAVAIGMVFAATLGEKLGISEPGLTGKTISVLEGLGLPTSATEPFTTDEILPVMQRDKKALDGIRFVFVPRLGEAVMVRPEPDVVESTLRSFSQGIL